MTIIGVIGGAGVAATNKLQELIENELTQSGAYRDCHHPEMIIWQATKAPSRSLFLEGKGESFIPEYINIAKKLKSMGATKLCMCCNTAHFAIDEISKAADIEIINLVENCIKTAKQNKIKKVGLIASDGCLKGRVYEKSFERIYPEAEIIYPDENFQKLVTKGICNIKNIHRFDNKASEENPENIFKNVKKHLLEKGAEKIITGCTDIRVAYHESDNIDSLEVLKDVILSEYCLR
ncbi:amino acid racemase [bacterium]|nr:amino acid racemase [bacterium]